MQTDEITRIATARFVAIVRAVRDTISGVYRMKSRLRLVKPDAENRAVAAAGAPH